MKKLIYMFLWLAAVSSAAIREERSEFQYSSKVAFSNFVRIGYYDATNNVFPTNTFPVAFSVTTKDGVILPSGTTAQRPSGGILNYPIIRYNSEFGKFEYKYNTTNWNSLAEYSEIVHLSTNVVPIISASDTNLSNTIFPPSTSDTPKSNNVVGATVILNRLAVGSHNGTPDVDGDFIDHDLLFEYMEDGSGLFDVDVAGYSEDATNGFIRLSGAPTEVDNVDTNRYGWENQALNKTSADVFYFQRYPYFIIPMYDGTNQYSEFELKASTNNFIPQSIILTNSGNSLSYTSVYTGILNHRPVYEGSLFKIYFETNDTWVYTNVISGFSHSIPRTRFLPPLYQLNKVPVDGAGNVFWFNEDPYFYWGGSEFTNTVNFDTQANIYYIANGPINTGMSRFKLATNESLTDVTFTSWTRTMYVEIWPSVDQFPQLDPSNSKLQFFFTRKSATSGYELNANGDKVYHPIEPQWKMYRKE
jgi:hypothetical protein